MEYTGKIIRENLARLQGDRSILTQRYEECRMFASPSKYGTAYDLREDSNTQRQNVDVPPEIVTDYLAGACFVFSRGFSSNLFPATVQWFGFSVRGKGAERVNRFMKSAAERLYTIIYSSSNFSVEINELIEDAGCVGTTCISVEKDPKRIFRLKNHDIQNVWIEESELGTPDTVYRLVPMTAIQILNHFHEEDDRIPAEIREHAASAENSRSGKVYSLIHFVAPNRKRRRDDSGKPEPGRDNLPWLSIWVDRKSGEIIRKSGYSYMPYIVGRIDNPVNGVYSDSPMMRSLRTARSMNKAYRSYAQATQMAVEPPALVDMAAYNGILPEVFFSPGTVNVYDSKGGQFAPPQFYVPPANLPMGREFILDERHQIDQFWGTELFTLITNLNQQSGRQRTAYEIQQLVAEKNNMIMPLVARFLDETVSPLLRTMFFIGLEAGVFGEPPPELENLTAGMIDLEYFSPLALAAQRNRISGTLSAMEIGARLSAVDPGAGVMDIFNLDAIMRDIAETYGAYPDHLREDGEIRRIRSEREKIRMQQQQQSMALEAMKSQDITAPIADSSMAGQLLGGGTR